MSGAARPGAAADAAVDHPGERQRHGSLGARLNRLRAGVLGANDGITSTAGIVVACKLASAVGAVHRVHRRGSPSWWCQGRAPAHQVYGA